MSTWVIGIPNFHIHPYNSSQQRVVHACGWRLHPDSPSGQSTKKPPSFWWIFGRGQISQQKNCLQKKTCKYQQNTLSGRAKQTVGSAKFSHDFQPIAWKWLAKSTFQGDTVSNFSSNCWASTYCCPKKISLIFGEWFDPYHCNNFDILDFWSARAMIFPLCFIIFIVYGCSKKFGINHSYTLIVKGLSVASQEEK